MKIVLKWNCYSWFDLCSPVTSAIHYPNSSQSLIEYIVLMTLKIEFSDITFTARKLSPLSVARALAIIVLEHPGGPYINIPLGWDIPILMNASGCFNGHSTACFNLSFICSWPPMSLHKTCYGNIFKQNLSLLGRNLLNIHRSAMSTDWISIFF